MNEILLEYYQGKTKELIKCEGYIREIIALIKEDHSSGIFTKRHVYRSAPPCAALEKELANFFNVSEIKIYWDGGEVNAYTLPAFSFTIQDHRHNYKMGRFSDFKMHIAVYENIIYEADLNEQEVLAAILHEIGHNFYYCPITAAFEIFFIIVTIPMGLLQTLINRGLYSVSAAVKDWSKKHVPILFNIADLYHDVVNNISSFGVFFAPLKVGLYIATAIFAIITGQINILGGITGYGGEKGADSMAAKYGYGPELASGLKKMSSPKNRLGYRALSKTGAFGSVMDDLSTLSMDIVAGMLMDPHPSNNQRAASLIKKLRKDLASGEYPPEAEKDLRNEIDRMEKAFEAVNDPVVESDVRIKKAWYELFNSVTDNHTDIREIFNFYYEDKGF